MRSSPDTLLMLFTAREELKNNRIFPTKPAKIRLPQSGMVIESITIASISKTVMFFKSKNPGKTPM